MGKTLPKLAVLISGNGSNLQSIIEHVAQGKLQARIEVVISNQPNAFGLERAHKAGIPTMVIAHEMYESRKAFDRALLNELSRFDIEWVVLSGFMRILGTEFLSKYNNKVINIHPSLLPKYPGLQAIQKAFENVESETGVTVHYVNEGVDTGSIIMQEKVEITAEDTLETLEKRVHDVEHQLYPKAIQKVLWDE